MGADRTIPFALVAGSLALAGAGLGLLIRREILAVRQIKGLEGIAADLRRVRQISCLDARISTLEAASRREDA